MVHGGIRQAHPSARFDCLGTVARRLIAHRDFGRFGKTEQAVDCTVRDLRPVKCVRNFGDRTADAVGEPVAGADLGVVHFRSGLEIENDHWSLVDLVNREKTGAGVIGRRMAEHLSLIHISSESRAAEVYPLTPLLGWLRPSLVSLPSLRLSRPHIGRAPSELLAVMVL